MPAKQDDKFTFFDGFTDLLENEYKQESEAVKKESLKWQQLLNDVRDTFAPGHGRRVLMHLLNSVFLYQSTFTGNSKTYHNIGIEDFGKALLDLIAAADPETYTWVHMQRVNEIHENILKRIIAEKE